MNSIDRVRTAIMPRAAHLAVAALLLVSTGPALAQDDAGAAARQLWTEGLKHADEGRFAEAAEAFQRAYESLPRFQVLFNLGQVYIRLGRSVDAVATLERYLAEGGRSVPAEKRAEAGVAIEEQTKRVCEVAVYVSAEGALLRVDGNERGKSPMVGPLRLDAGRHVITATLDGYAPADQSFTVSAGERARVDIELTPTPAPRVTPGRLLLDCPVPAMLVTIDGHPIGKTPFSTVVIVAADRHEVSFTRPGYASSRDEITVSPGAELRLSCGARVLSPVPPAAAARLLLDIGPSAAHVRVDGAPLPGDGVVPAGPHRVEIRHDDYEAWTGEIDIAPGRTEVLRPALQPKPVPPDPVALKIKAHRTWAAVAGGLGGAGLLVGAIGGLIALDRRPIIEHGCLQGSCTLAGKRAADAAQQAGATSTIGFSVAGAGLATVITLLLTAPRSAKHGSGAASIIPTITPKGRGAYTAVEWSF